MSSTELAVLQDNPVDINKAFGFNSKMKPTIPLLKIEGADDENGVVKAPKGTFVYDDGDKLLYAEEVNFRTFFKGYQYVLYDGKDKSKNDRSIIGVDFDTEYRSTSGRIACGKLSKKRLKELGTDVSKTQQYYQDKAKCKLILFGLVSGDFTNVDTKEKTVVEDALCIWQVSSSAFIAMTDILKGIEKERRPVPLTPIRLTLKKERNGTVTYYMPIPQVQNGTAKFVLERDQGFLQRIHEFVKDTNDYVNEKYRVAIEGANQNDNFTKVKAVVNSGDMPDDPLEL